MGLKLGIYSDAAETTCGGFLGGLGFEDQDAAQWAAWGPDFLKYGLLPRARGPGQRHRTLQPHGGRPSQDRASPFVFAVRMGGRAPHLWGRKVGGHQWRVSGDLFDSWTDLRVEPAGWWAMGLDSQFDRAAALAPYGGPGGLADDLDMLVIGLKKGGHIGGLGLTPVERRTHMTLFSIACSPLMIGCDLAFVGDADLALLRNPEVLAVNQDALGRPGRRVLQKGPLEAWTKPLADGSLALALFNRGSQAAEFRVTAADLGLLDGPKQVRDLWSGLEVDILGAQGT